MGDYFREIPVIYHNKEIGTLDIGPKGIYDKKPTGPTEFHSIFNEAYDMLIQKFPEKEHDDFLITVVVPDKWRTSNAINQRVIEGDYMSNRISNMLRDILDDIESIEITDYEFLAQQGQYPDEMPAEDPLLTKLSEVIREKYPSVEDQNEIFNEMRNMDGDQLNSFILELLTTK